MRRPAAVEEGQHRGVAGEDPGLRDRRRRLRGIGDVRRCRGRERLRQALRQFRRPAPPKALRWRHGPRARGSGAKARLAASARISERGLRPSARARAMKARTSRGASPAMVRERRAARRDARRKRRKAVDVALIGFDGLRAHPPLGGKIGEPAQPAARSARVLPAGGARRPNRVIVRSCLKNVSRSLSRHAAAFPPRWRSASVQGGDARGWRARMSAGDPFDVAVIGGGVVGCAVARRFTLDGARVVLLERGADILSGASKANSALLHTGFDAPPDSLELAMHAGRLSRIPGDPAEPQSAAARDRRHGRRLDRRGARPARRRSRRRRSRTGSATCAGSGRPRSWRASRIWRRAPGALLVPGEHVIDPWSAPLAYLAAGVMNGAEGRFGAEVDGRQARRHAWRLGRAAGLSRPGRRQLRRAVRRHGGGAASRAARFTIRPRKGQFVVFDKAAARLLAHHRAAGADRAHQGRRPGPYDLWQSAGRADRRGAG